MIKKFRCVLTVLDLEKSVKYYSEVLGFDVYMIEDLDCFLIDNNK
ncbi:VOC family protein [Hanstruepera marina]